MSAIANAKNNFKIEKDVLVVKELRVDAGKVLKRRMPRARGNSYPINKRTSHVLIVLAPRAEKEVEKKPKALKAKK
jgi:large subunit ribosomal protein L22